MSSCQTRNCGSEGNSSLGHLSIPGHEPAALTTLSRFIKWECGGPFLLKLKYEGLCFQSPNKNDNFAKVSRCKSFDARKFNVVLVTQLSFISSFTCPTHQNFSLVLLEVVLIIDHSSLSQPGTRRFSCEYQSHNFFGNTYKRIK